MPRSRRWSSLRVVAIVVALGMVPLVATAWFVGEQARIRDRAALDSQLVNTANAQRAALETYSARARAVLLVTAQNPVFESFYDLPGSRAGRIRAGGSVLDRVNAALAYLGRLYPQSIGAASFIDRTGAENARAVQGDPAAPSRLSAAAADADYFGPTFARPPGRVYQPRPYVSPDTGEWVISNSTLLPDHEGAAHAILHFEVTIDSFRRAAARVGGRFSLEVVDSATGRIVIDSERPQVANAPLGRGANRGESPLVVAPGPAHMVDRAGQRVAVARLPINADNANRWYVVARADGEPTSRSLDLLGPWTGGVILGLILIGIVVARRWEHRAQEALTDPLTGLPNRRLLNDRLNQTIVAARRQREMAAVMVLDVDRFKDVNDTLGHDAGDRLLGEVAGRLRGALRESDTLARLGGDEFAVLLPTLASRAAALAVAAKLRAALAAPLTLDGVTIEVEASIGVAVFPKHGTDGVALLRAADVAMYVAKTTRAGQVAYSPEHDRHTPERLAVMGELRRAIEGDELVVHYQPKVNILTGRVQGVEALVRWRHPRRGLLGPGEFIALAEQTALMKPLTLFVLERALTDCRRWEDEGITLSVAVNLSANTLLDESLSSDVAAALERSGIAPERLELEITETVLMNDPARALGVIESLHALGVRLAIDDFGVGYSSLGYLKRLPVDVLKIDRSFVMEMMDSPEDAMIVRSTIDLARNLGLSTVAEGVETQAALAELRDLDCDFAQGFHFCRPAPADELLAWVRVHDQAAIRA